MLFRSETFSRFSHLRWAFFAVMLSVNFISGCTKCTDSEPGDKTAGSGDPTLGIGPVTKVDLDANVDAALASTGKKTFEAKCVACHKLETKYVGPALHGITKRRKPEWIMNMILNPSEMTQKDPVAKALLSEYLTQMANQSLTKDDARAVLEYFRSLDNATP